MTRVETFVADDISMTYTASGSETGRSFVLVHGIGMGGCVFDSLGAELGRVGEVYAVDLPGFGDSPEPPVPGTIEATGDYIAKFIRSLSVQNPVLVGHSMGTQIIAEVLVRHPDLATHAVLIAPTVNDRECSAKWQMLRMVQDLWGESPRILSLGLVQYGKAGIRWFTGKMSQMLAHDMLQTLPKIRAQVLVIRGSEDWVCPRGWVRRVTESIPGAAVREIHGHGHETMIRHGRPTAELITAWISGDAGTY